jgi:hypothetical protein
MIHVFTPPTRRPTKGTALLFFPAAGGIANAPLDIRTLHCGEAVAEDAGSEKWIAQVKKIELVKISCISHPPFGPLFCVHGFGGALSSCAT